MSATTVVLKEVHDERGKQDAKWGAGRVLAPRTWITVLAEEFGEVARADLERDPGGYRLELIQLAAVAVAAVESFDLEQAGHPPKGADYATGANK